MAKNKNNRNNAYNAEFASEVANNTTTKQNNASANGNTNKSAKK